MILIIMSMFTITSICGCVKQLRRPLIERAIHADIMGKITEPG